MTVHIICKCTRITFQLATQEISSQVIQQRLYNITCEDRFTLVNFKCKNINNEICLNKDIANSFLSIKKKIHIQHSIQRNICTYKREVVKLSANIIS